MGATALRVVSNELPSPPYPADTRAKGWKFEFDYERLEQSATWKLATDDLRPWLLMLWLQAWKSAPAGSLEDDDRTIAGSIRMPLNMFQMHRETLLRGWTLHNDGRLYHDTIAEKVLEMLDIRAGFSKRQAEHRAKVKQGLLAADVTRDTDVTNSESRESSLPEPVPVPTKTESKAVARASRTPALKGSRLSPDWVLGVKAASWALEARKDWGWTDDDVRRCAALFKDHWLGKSGRDATKHDWPATWRKWVNDPKSDSIRRKPQGNFNGKAERRAEAIHAFTGPAGPDEAGTDFIEGDSHRVG